MKYGEGVLELATTPEAKSTPACLALLGSRACGVKLWLEFEGLFDALNAVFGI